MDSLPAYDTVFGRGFQLLFLPMVSVVGCPTLLWLDEVHVYLCNVCCLSAVRPYSSCLSEVCTHMV